MGVPHITSFFCCCGLELGAKCVGLLHLLASITLMIVCAVYAESFRVFVGTAEDAGDHLYSTLYKITVGVAIVSVVHVLLAATLLVSVFKRHTGGIVSWVCVMCVLYCASILMCIILVCTYGFSGTGSDIFLSFLEGLLFYGIVGYCILCVYSYYLMLKSVEDMEGPNKSMY